MAAHRTAMPEGGASQRGPLSQNERLILATIRRGDGVPGSEIARATGLSAQTVSVILRDLEADGLVTRGEPVRGRVGKPSTPMRLVAEGAFSVGLKIGRRSADLVLMDLHGALREQRQMTYRYPLPGPVFEFLADGLAEMIGGLPAAARERVAGIGVAAPFEIWKWHDSIGAPAEEFVAWRDVTFSEVIAAFSPLPVYVMNDATAACHAEQYFGEGAAFTDYAYFFVGAFIGGGVVLNGAVIEGNRGNAGALGSLQSVDTAGRPVQLIDTASLYLLEAAVAAAGGDPACLWRRPQDWSGVEPQLGPWIARAGTEIARAAVSACAVVDFDAVIVDGAFPPEVRARLVAAVRAALDGLDTRGILRPEVVEGRVGGAARGIGAAYGPISAQFFGPLQVQTAGPGPR